MLQISKEKAILIFAHSVGWIIFIATPIINDTNMLARISRHPGLFILDNLFLLTYFYLNLNVLVPHFLSKKKILAFIGLSLGGLLLYFVITWVVPQHFFAELSRHRPDMPFHRPEMSPHHRPEMPFPKVDVMQQLKLYTRLTHFLIVFTISSGLKVLTQWYDEKRRLTELENSKVEAELSFLKSQIHPHFLFNSLNSIYYLALSKDDKAPQAILSLSDFLRFVTIESDKNLIPLEKEIKMLNEYLNLQSLRASEKFDLQVNMKGDFSFWKIMPLVFIPFVENAFKYGISAHVDCFIHLNIEMADGTLEFTIENAIFQGQKDIMSSSGIGLENIKKRLELAYPDRHTLAIESDRQTYSVHLKINLSS